MSLLVILQHMVQYWSQSFLARIRQLCLWQQVLQISGIPHLFLPSHPLHCPTSCGIWSPMTKGSPQRSGTSLLVVMFQASPFRRLSSPPPSLSISLLLLGLFISLSAGLCPALLHVIMLTLSYQHSFLLIIMLTPMYYLHLLSQTLPSRLCSPYA